MSSLGELELVLCTKNYAVGFIFTRELSPDLDLLSFEYWLIGHMLDRWKGRVVEFVLITRSGSQLSKECEYGLNKPPIAHIYEFDWLARYFLNLVKRPTKLI